VIRLRHDVDEGGNGRGYIKSKGSSSLNTKFHRLISDEKIPWFTYSVIIVDASPTQHSWLEMASRFVLFDELLIRARRCNQHDHQSSGFGCIA
jgi:hypothetical protein